jgi:hypothetical protein
LRSANNHNYYFSPSKYFISMRSIIILLLIGIAAAAHAQSFDWVKQGGSSFSDEGRGIVADGQGNIYVAGTYRNNAVFGSTMLASAGARDLFLAKYDAAGTLHWVIRDGAWYDDGCVGLALGTNNSLYVAGYYLDTIIVAGDTLIEPNTNGGHYLAKYNTSGNGVWAIEPEKTGKAEINDISTDAAGNVYITGTFQTMAVFGQDTVTSNFNNIAVYITEFDPAGNVLKVVTAPAAGGAAYSVCIDAQGNMYVSGYYASGIEFPNNTLLTYPQDNNMFVAKYGSNGDFLWAQEGAGPKGSVGSTVSVSSTGDVYVGGSFNDSITFGTTTYCDSAQCGFLVKYDAGGVIQWVDLIPAYSINVSSSGIDAQDNCIITGSYSGTATFGNTNLPGSTSEVFRDIFIAGYNPQGNAGWAVKAGSAADDTGYDIAVEPSSSIYITGYFSNVAFFSPTYITSAGSSDFFIASLPNTTSINEISIEDAVSIYPNPSDGSFTIEYNDNTPAAISVIDMLGREVYKQALDAGSTNIDLHTLPKGCYFIKLVSGNRTGAKRLIIQ